MSVVTRVAFVMCAVLLISCDRSADITNIVKAGSQSRSAASVRIEPAELDFGTTQTNSTCTGTVKIRNYGLEPQRIAKTARSCGCTAIDVDQSYLSSGDSITATIQLSTRRRHGALNRTVTFYLEPSGEMLTLPVRAEVVDSVVCDPPTYSPSLSSTTEFVLQSTDSSSFQIFAVDPPVFDYGVQRADNHVMVLDENWSALAQDVQHIRISTDHPKKPTVLIANNEWDEMVADSSPTRRTEDGGNMPVVVDAKADSTQFIDFSSVSTDGQQEQQVILGNCGFGRSLDELEATGESPFARYEVLDAHNTTHGLQCRLRMRRLGKARGQFRDKVRISSTNSEDVYIVHVQALFI